MTVIEKIGMNIILTHVNSLFIVYTLRTFYKSALVPLFFYTWNFSFQALKFVHELIIIITISCKMF